MLGIRRNFLTPQAVQQWNRLPCGVVSSPGTSAFKQRLVFICERWCSESCTEQGAGLDELCGPFQLYDNMKTHRRTNTINFTSKGYQGQLSYRLTRRTGSQGPN